MLVLLRRWGLVWDITQAQDLPARPERLALDGAVLPEAQPAPQASLHVLRACLALARTKEELQLTSPCATLPAWALRCVVRRNVAIHTSPFQHRLQLTGQGMTLSGMPALALAMWHSRHIAAACAALVLLPLALATEAVRAQFA
jgi:hypothetical protein